MSPSVVVSVKRVLLPILPDGLIAKISTMPFFINPNCKIPTVLFPKVTGAVPPLVFPDVVIPPLVVVVVSAQ